MQLSSQAHGRVQAAQQQQRHSRAKPFSSSRPVHAAAQQQTPHHKRAVVVARAQADDDAGLEERLAALRRAKGATPDKEGTKAAKKRSPIESSSSSSSASSSSGSGSGSDKKKYDWTDETVHWEGGPAAGDLAFNLALGTTLVALPLTVGAVARTAFVKYRFTDKRVSVITSAPWEMKQTDCAYQEVRDVRVVSRGLGLWGDMVIELSNGDKLELRSLEKFKELRDYVLARAESMGGGPPKSQKGNNKIPSMMDLDMDDAEAMKKGGKGFA